MKTNDLNGQSIRWQKIRELAFKLGYEPTVPSKKNFKEQWEYDKELYKQRNDLAEYKGFVEFLSVTIS